MVLADKAQLLVVTALAVGRARAVPIAARTVGHETLEEAVPYLQHAALDPAVWHAVKARDWSLEELRVMAELETGSAPRELEELRRVSWVSILKLALIGLVAYGLISAISNVGIDTIIAEFQSASKGWVVAALLLTPLVQVPQAVSTLGATIQRLRYWPVLMLQYGIQFIALAVPSSAARVALEIRFFERVGVPAAGAVSIRMIDSVSGFCIQLLLIVVITISGLATLDIAADSTSSSDSTSGVDWETLLTAFGLLAIAFLAALLVPRFRSMMTRFLHGLRERAADGRDALKVLRHPDKLLFLFGGNLIAQVMLAIILGLCLKAFGYSATLAELILVNTFVRRTHRDRHPRVGRRIDRAHGPADHLLHSTHVGVVRHALDARAPIPVAPVPASREPAGSRPSPGPHSYEWARGLPDVSASEGHRRVRRLGAGALISSIALDIIRLG